MFTLSHLQQTLPYVDYYSIMTYDYPGKGCVVCVCVCVCVVLIHLSSLGPVAPIDWVRRNIQYLLNGGKNVGEHLLMGLNFYGYTQKEHSNIEPIVGNRYIAFIVIVNCQCAVISIY
jgi:spore germination protein YaaH